MKTFLLDIFPKIQQYSLKLDDITLLTNQHWVAIDNIIYNKEVYIFRGNNELLVSNNGKVEKGRWEYLGNKSLLIDRGNESYLFKHGFIDENIMALKVDSSYEYALFVNENKYDGELNSVERISDFLQKKYLNSNFTRQVHRLENKNDDNFKDEVVKDFVNISDAILILIVLGVIIFILTEIF